MSATPIQQLNRVLLSALMSKETADIVADRLEELGRELADANQLLSQVDTARIDWLKAELAEARRDSARLDWLEVDATEHATLAFNKWYEGAGNFRAAIDAAMEAGK